MTTNLDDLTLSEYIETLEALVQHPAANKWIKGTYMVGMIFAVNSMKRRLVKGDYEDQPNPTMEE